MWKKYFRIFISIYQIFGGLLGCYSLVVNGLELLTKPLTAIFSLLLVIFSLYTGFILLFNNPDGYKFTIINQLMQVIKIKILGYGFEYLMGIPIYIGFTDTPKFRWFLGLDFSIIYQVFIYFKDPQFENTLVFNIIPIILIIIIEKAVLTTKTK